MKILCGEVPSLVGLVRKRVKLKIDELNNSLEEETQQRIGRANEQAKQLKDQILEKAAKDAKAEHEQILRSAQQEAKQMLIQARGRMESLVLGQVREELARFVKGERKIGTAAYEGLVKKALDEGKKRKTEFKVVKHEDGVVLVGADKELDLRVDSMLSLLGALPLPEVKPGK